MIKRLLALLPAALCIILTLGGCKPPDRELSAAEQEMFRDRTEALIADSGISAAVYIVHHGSELFAGGSGTAAPGIENGPDAVYGIASLTKQFTAACILQLYDAGRLDIDDRLSEYFPSYAYGDKITLRQLMSMRSGIPDYSVDSIDGRVLVTCEGSEDESAEISAENTAAENIAVIRDHFLSRELLFEPGEEANYSDSNYALLAQIIAQTSGMSFHRYVREHIFAPLGMETASFIDEQGGGSVVVAQCDRSEFDGDYFLLKGAEYGCGDILISPRDLYRWYHGLTGGKVISEKSYRLMTSNYSDPDESGYGFGLFIDDSGDTKVYSHFGYIPAYYSMVIYIPAYDYFEVVLANRGDGVPYTRANEIAACFGEIIGLDLGKIG